MGAAVALVETGTDGLVYYERAKIALEQARTADEVNHIRGIAEGLRASAIVAQNRELETTAAEIRIRANRRLGEMLLEHKNTVGFSKGGRPAETTSELAAVIPTLEEIGVSHKLSTEAQNLAAVPPDEFEDKILHWRRKEGRVTVSLYFNGDAPGIPHRPSSSKCHHPSLPGDAADLAYHEMVGLFIARRKALGLSQADLDEDAGWVGSQASKYEIPHVDVGRIASGTALVEWARALGLGIQLVPLV